MISDNRWHGAFLALMVTALIAPSGTALADKEGGTYRGKVHCTDLDALIKVQLRLAACKRYDHRKEYYPFGSKESVDCVPMPLSHFMDMDKALSTSPNWAGSRESSIWKGSGKLLAGNQSAWMRSEVLATIYERPFGKIESRPKPVFLAPNVPFIAITKTSNSQVALNALICPLTGGEYYHGEEHQMTSGPPTPLVLGKEVSGRIPHDAAAGTRLQLALAVNRKTSTRYLVYLESESLFPVDYTISIPTILDPEEEAAIVNTFGRRK